MLPRRKMKTVGTASCSSHVGQGTEIEEGTRFPECTEMQASNDSISSFLQLVPLIHTVRSWRPSPDTRLGLGDGTQATFIPTTTVVRQRCCEIISHCDFWTRNKLHPFNFKRKWSKGNFGNFVIHHEREKLLHIRSACIHWAARWFLMGSDLRCGIFYRKKMVRGHLERTEWIKWPVQCTKLEMSFQMAALPI